jgi:mono/diheme cytochrome c family protein
MSKKSVSLKLCVLLASAFLLTACGGGGENEANENEDSSTQYKTVPSGDTAATPAGTTPSAATIASGKTLYNNNCFSCHGANYSNARDSNRTLAAIASNKGGMGYLEKTIQAPQANDIAAYLSYGL